MTAGGSDPPAMNERSKSMTTQFRDNYATTAGVPDEGTNPNTFKITNPVSYSIGGIGYYKGATDNLPFSAGHAALGNSQRCAFFVCLDAAGNVTTLQSPIVPPSPAGDSRAAVEIPNPTDRAVIGAIVVTTGAAATFTPNSTDLSAAGITFTKVSYCVDYGTSIQV